MLNIHLDKANEPKFQNEDKILLKCIMKTSNKLYLFANEDALSGSSINIDPDLFTDLSARHYPENNSNSSSSEDFPF